MAAVYTHIGGAIPTVWVVSTGSLDFPILNFGCTSNGRNLQPYQGLSDKDHSTENWYWKFSNPPPPRTPKSLSHSY